MYEDSHLEMAFEDRVSGPMGCEPDDGWDYQSYPEPYEPGPYTGDEPDWDNFYADYGDDGE